MSNELREMKKLRDLMVAEIEELILEDQEMERAFAMGEGRYDRTITPRWDSMLDELEELNAAIRELEREEKEER